jgi:hypothetical protein
MFAMHMANSCGAPRAALTLRSLRWAWLAPAQAAHSTTAGRLSYAAFNKGGTHSRDARSACPLTLSTPGPTVVLHTIRNVRGPFVRRGGLARSLTPPAQVWQVTPPRDSLARLSLPTHGAVLRSSDAEWSSRRAELLSQAVMVTWPLQAVAHHLSPTHITPRTAPLSESLQCDMVMVLLPRAELGPRPPLWPYLLVPASSRCGQLVTVSPVL